MILIIGAGISGLTLGRQLRDDFLIFEKNAVPGGLSTLYPSGKYWFAYGGHYFHFHGKEEIRAHLERIRPFRCHRRRSLVHLQERFIHFPLQYHLADLPAPLRRQALRDFPAAPPPRADNLEEFLLGHFGPTLYGLFFSPFLGKYYRTPLAELAADMDKGSIPVPDRASVLAGARGKRFHQAGYNATFYHPVGDLKRFIEAYAAPVGRRLRCNEEVIRVDTAARRVFTTRGSYPYDVLVNTIPLKDFLRLTGDPAWQRAADGLRHISSIIVNLVLARRRRRFHWVYLPEADFPFYRAGYYPAGRHTQVYLERTPLPGEDCTDPAWMDGVTATLQRIGMIREKSEILHSDILRLPVSYILFDRDWRALVPPLLEKLQAGRIHSIGRYGAWNYSSMSDDIREALALGAALQRP